MRYALLALLLVAGCESWRQPPPLPVSPEIDNIKSVVLEVSDTPSTIRFFSVEVAEQSGMYVMGIATYDEQNKFGALIRHRSHVIYRHDGQGIRWLKANHYAVQDLGDSLELVGAFKGVNHWPKESK